MRLRTLLALLTAVTLAGGGLSSVNAESVPAAAQIAETERAFAAAATRDGTVAAFQAYVADDAVALEGDAVTSASKPWRARTNHKGKPLLEWGPVWTGAARSGDLGFSTGPFRFDEGKAYGYYFTIWKRQADGSWKWVVDHGAPLAAEQALPSPADTRYAISAGISSASPAEARDQVRRIEARMARRATTDAAGAYRPHIARDSRIMGLEPAPAVGREAVLRALAARPRNLTLKPLGDGASSAGDLVYTYGSARWTAGGKVVSGNYVRVWQKRREGWVLVFDEVTPPQG